MEEWELDFKWLEIRHQIKDLFKRDNLPDFQSILFLIGLQELGKVQDTFSKEEKQDLMHIAVCKLMSIDGYYSFVGLDDQGWPHWKQVKLYDKKGVEQQEQYLKKKIIQYFSNLDEPNE